jgi:hypothetical protein
MNRKVRIPVELSKAAAALSKSNPALRDLETRTSHAWKSKFQQQLKLAESYFPTTRPQTREDRAAVEDVIESLKKLLRGRPPGKATYDPSRVRVENDPSPEDMVAVVVVQVEQAQLSWLTKNKRRRVPGKITNELIDKFTKDTNIDAAKIRKIFARR